MSVPGAFYADDDDAYDGSGLVDESDDPDFEPIEQSGDDDPEDETEMEDAEAAEDDDDMRIAIDRQTNRIYIVRSNGEPIPVNLNDSNGNAGLRLLESILGQRTRTAQANPNRPRHTGQEDEDEDEDEEDDDDYTEGGGGLASLFGRGHGRGPLKPLYPIVREPDPKGQQLERSGEFGPVPKKYSDRRAKTYSSNVVDSVRKHVLSPPNKRARRADTADSTVPNSVGVVVAQYDANPYCGQYSDDGSFFYTASQDFRVRIYKGDTPIVGRNKGTFDSTPRRAPSHFARRRGLAEEERSSMKLIKSIQAYDSMSRWTITDANLSPDNESLIYSSISPVVNMVRTREGAYTVEGFGEDASDHIQLNFANSGRRDFGIWSIRFSGDAREIVAGASSGGVFAYDVERRTTTLRVAAHEDDVNAVSFADSSSSNVLVSGSDDSFIKVWDRRSLRGQKPSGVLPGHTEGITFLTSAGDGRYVASNGKDQTCKLFDLRKMVSSDTFDRMTPKHCGVPGFDYRVSHVYAKPRYQKHPHDASVMTFTGHTVLSTLIRCHFSPLETTGQRYIISGSADGRVHIWSIDGRPVQILDRRDTLPFLDGVGQQNDPFNAPAASSRIDSRHWGTVDCTVRDVSWHPREPTMCATSGSAGLTPAVLPLRGIADAVVTSALSPCTDGCRIDRADCTSLSLYRPFELASAVHGAHTRRPHLRSVAGASMRHAE